MAARHEEECYEKNVFPHFLVCNGLSNEDAGVTRGTVFQETRPGAGSKTGDFATNKLGVLT